MAFFEDGKGISPQVWRGDRNWNWPVGCFGEGYVPPGITDARLVERWRARVLHGLIEPRPVMTSPAKNSVVVCMVTPG
jgi:hypothetical protein